MTNSKLFQKATNSTSNSKKDEKTLMDVDKSLMITNVITSSNINCIKFGNYNQI